MDTDTYPRKEVVDFVNARFVPLVQNFWADEGLAATCDVQGTPAQAIITPAGKLMGRRTGYLNAPEYLEWMAAVVETYPRVEQLEARLQDAPKDLAVRGDLALALLRTGVTLAARDHIAQVLDGASKRADASEAEKLAAARCAIAIMDSWLHSFYGERVDAKVMLRTCALVRDLDPSNRSGMHAEAAAFEAFTHLSTSTFDKAVESARAGLRLSDDGPRHDMLRFCLGAGLSHLGRTKNDPALAEEGRQALLDVLEKHRMKRYWNHATTFLENFKYPAPKAPPEK